MGQNPFVADLQARTGMTASFGVLDGTEVEFVHRVYSHHDTRRSDLCVGRVAASRSAAGLLLLAHEEAAVQKLISEADLRVSDVAELGADLARVRRSGFSVLDDPSGCVSLAVPLALPGVPMTALRAVKTAYTGETTLCMSINDLQVGKAAGGGTEALAERLDTAYAAVAARAKELRRIGRDLGQLVILGGGDIVEGCSIFPNQSFEIDGDRRTQTRNAVTFILEGLDRLAPLFERVQVLAVGGNHGENRIGGKRTTRHDNDDCAVFEHAALAAARDSRLGHVEFSIAQDEPVKTLDVHGWILGTTHGQVFGRGSGSIEQRAYKWYSGQAAGHMPAGDCHLLISHHYHHFAARDWGATMWVQTPAMDGGSAFFTDFSGQSSEPGMLTWTMSREKRFADPNE